MRILFLSPVNPKLTPGEPLPRWQMQASWVRALGRLGHEVRVVKYTPEDRIRLGWGEKLMWNLKVIKAAILDGVSSMRSARNPRSLRRRRELGVGDKVLLGSSSMISETPSSVRFRIFRSLLVWSIDSQRMYLADRRVLAARGDRSPRLPMGVETINRVPLDSGIGIVYIV